MLHSEVLLAPLSRVTAPPTSSDICLTEQMGLVVLMKGQKIWQPWGLKLQGAFHARKEG